MIELTPHAEGTILPVRAQPGSKRDAVLEKLERYR